MTIESHDTSNAPSRSALDGPVRPGRIGVAAIAGCVLVWAALLVTGPLAIHGVAVTVLVIVAGAVMAALTLGVLRLEARLAGQTNSVAGGLKSEAKLPAQERQRRQLEAVLDTVPVTLQIVDQDMRYQWANQAYGQLLGRDASELVGRHMRDTAYDRENVDRTIAVNHQLLAAGHGQMITEQRIAGRDNRPERHLRVIKAVIAPVPGEKVQILSIGIDVTAQRQAEREAEAGRRLMEAILQHAPLGIHVKDAALRYCWANQAFSDLVGHEAASLIGRTLREISPRDEDEAGRDRTDARDRAVLQSGERVEFSTIWRSQGVDRSYMIIKAPIRGDDGVPTHVITLIADITEQIRLRADAEEARHLLQTVMDALPITLALKDRDRRYRWVNQAFEQAWGVHAGNILGHTIEELDGTDLGSLAAAEIEVGLMQSGDEPLVQIRPTPISSAGSQLLSIRTLPLRSADQRISGLLSVGVNVTEQVRASEQLRVLNAELEARVALRTAELDRANTLLNTVISSSPVPIMTHDAAGRILIWNPAMEELSGIADAQINRQMVDPQRLPGLVALREVIDAVRGGHSVVDRNVVLTSRSGALVDVLANGAPLYNPDGSLRGGVVVLIDVTERRQAFRDAETTRNHLLDALDGSHHAIALYDTNDRLVLFNQYFLKAFPEIAEQIKPGIRFLELKQLALARGLLVIPDGQTEAAFLAECVARRSAGGPTQFIARHADGHSYEVWENPTRNGGVITMAADITHRLSMERQLVHAQRMEAVGQLTGGLAHDFNNLLASISLNLDLIRLHQLEMSRVDELVDAAHGAVQIGAALTRRLLSFARQQALRPEPTDVMALVDDLLPLLRSTVGEQVTLEITSTAQAAVALIDKSQLQTALLNLAANARDAMPEGGRLAISIGTKLIPAAGRMDEPPVSGHPAPGAYVTVAVRDSGSGIAPDVLPRVFEPFYSTKSPSHGSGLGLTMVFGFVAQSGGHITIDSQHGASDRGGSTRATFTCVTLFLPQTTTQVAAPALDHEVPQERHQGELILVVEDDAAVRAAVAQMLSHLGYRCLDAEDGPTAMVLLHENPDIAAMVSDVVLPNGMNGFELGARAQALRPDLALLFASGFTDPDRLGASTMPEGAVMMIKPFGMAELERELLSCLARSSVRRRFEPQTRQP